jgi:predicted  nucleic acid-binding Zn-ribbon protein
MRTSLVLIAFFSLLMPAQAQQPADQAMLQRVIAVLQAQRNQAMDVAANAEVQRAALAEEIEKLKARIAELEKAK